MGTTTILTTTMSIVAFIPDPLGRALRRVQLRLDPDGQVHMPPHVPLVGPFRAAPPFLPLERHCWRACHATAPFGVELGRLTADEGERGAHLPLAAGGEQLAALRRALLDGTNAPPSGDLPYEPFAAIGRVTNRDELAVELREDASRRSGRSFEVERVQLMTQYPDGTWYERDFYTLDRAVTRA